MFEITYRDAEGVTRGEFKTHDSNWAEGMLRALVHSGYEATIKEIREKKSVVGAETGRFATAATPISQRELLERRLREAQINMEDFLNRQDTVGMEPAPPHCPGDSTF